MFWCGAETFFGATCDPDNTNKFQNATGTRRKVVTLRFLMSGITQRELPAKIRGLSSWKTLNMKMTFLSNRKNFGEEETAWNTWTIHFNIALTKKKSYALQYSGTTRRLTRSDGWKTDKLVSKYFRMERSCSDCAQVAFCQFFTKQQRHLLQDWY